MFPSSHSSPGSILPSEQKELEATAVPSRIQRGEQPSPGIRFPSSHCSGGSRMELEQRDGTIGVWISCVSSQISAFAVMGVLVF